MRIEQYISDNSITVADFAMMIGVSSRATIHRYIKGRVPKPEILERIFKATDGKITANDFYKLNNKTSGKNSDKKSKVKKN